MSTIILPPQRTGRPIDFAGPEEWDRCCCPEAQDPLAQRLAAVLREMVECGWRSWAGEKLRQGFRRDHPEALLCRAEALLEEVQGHGQGAEP